GSGKHVIQCQRDSIVVYVKQTIVGQSHGPNDIVGAGGSADGISGSIAAEHEDFVQEVSDGERLEGSAGQYSQGTVRAQTGGRGFHAESAALNFDVAKGCIDRCADEPDLITTYFGYFAGDAAHAEARLAWIAGCGRTQIPTAGAAEGCVARQDDPR